jgi:hypothetical protein
MEEAAKRTILRIELWQAVLLIALLAVFSRSDWLDPVALLIGGVFMAINFLLLSFGVAWVLTPLASKGRVRAGIGLIILKIILFMGLLTMLFFRFDLDAISFALGFSTLIVAILTEALRRTLRFGI